MPLPHPVDRRLTDGYRVEIIHYFRLTAPADNKSGDPSARAKVCKDVKDLRARIAGLVREYYEAQFADRAFDPQKHLVHYAGRVFDAEEVSNLVDASLDFFLTANRYAESFEAGFAEYLGVS